MSKAVESKITGMIEGGVDRAGYNLVRVQITGNGKYANLQIMAERKDNAGMTVDDCAAISTLISEIVEADPDLAERYGLEVSSPGIDRPLVRLQDYVRFAGFVAKVETQMPIEGQKRFQGKILGVDGEKVEMQGESGVVKIDFTAINRAKLVITDELLKAAKSGKVSH